MVQMLDWHAILRLVLSLSCSVFVTLLSVPSVVCSVFQSSDRSFSYIPELVFLIIKSSFCFSFCVLLHGLSGLSGMLVYKEIDVCRE
jgi:hypothetical protein